MRVRLHCEIGGRQRDDCLTLIVFLMPYEVGVLWLALMVLRVGLHCKIDDTRELAA